MPLDIPNLDDRRFQELLDEARRKIAVLNPSWTDHNLSDPGITLLELFASLVETMIYRLNRVPEKSYITFLDLMGVQLEPPQPARTELTFWLSKPLIWSDDKSEPEAVLIPAGFEAATRQGIAEQPVSFTTDADLTVRPSHLGAILASNDEQNFANCSNCIALYEKRYEDSKEDSKESDESFQAFPPKPDGPEPQPGAAFYLGEKNDLSGHILGLRVNCSIEGIGVRPDEPPIAWEAWCGSSWQPVDVESDGTDGFNKEGQIVLHLPMGMTRRFIPEHTNQTPHEAYWVRCKVVEANNRQTAYKASPKISAIFPEVLGATTEARHATTIFQEILGRSDGTPSQRFRLEYTPVLSLKDGEMIQVQHGEKWEDWSPREHFGDSKPKDLHFTLDCARGIVSFGPLIREPDGRKSQHGAVPPAGAVIRFSRYRTGGGVRGNVGPNTLTEPKSSLSYVQRVSNRKRAESGRDAENIERAMLLAPQRLRTRYRAVTAEDYEYLVEQPETGYDLGIARARCLQPGTRHPIPGLEPGQIRLLLVPAVASDNEPTPIGRLVLTPKIKQAVEGYIDDRRLLTTTVELDTPSYKAVRVTATIVPASKTNAAVVRDQAIACISNYLDPLKGGPEHKGWPFARPLYIGELYAALQQVSGVQYVEDLQIDVSQAIKPAEYLELKQKAKKPTDASSTSEYPLKYEAAGRQIVLPEDCLIVAGAHKIEVRADPTK